MYVFEIIDVEFNLNEFIEFLKVNQYSIFSNSLLFVCVYVVTLIVLALICTLYSLFFIILNNDINNCVDKNDWVAVNFLLFVGSDPNKLDMYEATPLHYAVKNGNKYIIELLIKYGADVNKTSYKRFTPLTYALIRQEYVIANYLIDMNAELNVIDDYGYTQIHNICSYVLESDFHGYRIISLNLNYNTKREEVVLHALKHLLEKDPTLHEDTGKIGIKPKDMNPPKIIKDYLKRHEKKFNRLRNFKKALG